MPPLIIGLGSKNTTFTGGNAGYLMTGADGNNTVTLGDGDDQLALGAGNNTLTLGDGTDQINAGSGNNTITTGSGDDSVNLTDGNNTVTVGDGNDTVRAGNGANVVTAGDGNDNITLGDGINQVTIGNGNGSVIVGNGAGDAVIVGTGSNTIALGNGAADVVQTGSGGNTVFVSAAAVGADSIAGGLTTGDGSNNTLILTTAGDVNVGGVSGFETFKLGNGAPNTITLSNANFARLPGGSITVWGGDGANTVDASGLSTANSVSIHVGSGDSVLTGGAGNDFFFGSSGTSVVDGGGGINTMTFSGPMSDYTVSTVAGVTLVVGDGEAASLTNIQQLVFASAPVFYAALFDPPSIDGAVSGQTATDAVTMHPFSSITVADPNPGQTETVTVVLSNAADGRLSDADVGTDRSSYNVTTGTYMVSGTAAAVTTALRALVFTPTAHQVAPGHAVTTSFTVTDSNSLGAVVTDASTAVTATAQDIAPVLTAATLTGNLENSQSMVIGTVAAGLVGDTLSVAQAPGALGVVSLGAADQFGVQQVIYTAPAHIKVSGTDTVAYTITDANDGFSVNGSSTLTLDLGSVITHVAPVSLAAGQTAIVDTIVGGLPGDALTLTQAGPGMGSYALQLVSGDGSTTPYLYNVIYTETANFTTAQREVVGFQVTDRDGGKVNGDTPVIRLDPGTTIVNSVASVKATPGGSAVVIGTVAPGLIGGTLTITGGDGVPGVFSLGPVTGSGLQSILYTAPATVAVNHTVALSYTISDQLGINTVTGSSSANLQNLGPAITKATPLTLEKGETTVIGTVTPGASIDTLTVTQTGTATGTVSLGAPSAGGVVQVLYTAASAIAASGTASVGYTVTDEHTGSATGSASIVQDAGAKLSAATPGTVVKGQSTVIGTATPGLAGDTLHVTQTGSSQGSVTLVGNQVVYTAAAGVSSTGTDSVSYTLADQHNNAAVSGTATVKVLGAVASTSSAAITSSTANAFLDVSAGSPAMRFIGANSTVLLEGTASPAITDASSGLTIDIGSSTVSATVSGFTADAKSVIDLLHGVGGFTTATQAQAALVSDSHGGSLLSLGGGGFIDIANVAPGLVTAAHFKIG